MSVVISCHSYILVTLLQYVLWFRLYSTVLICKWNSSRIQLVLYCTVAGENKREREKEVGCLEVQLIEVQRTSRARGPSGEVWFDARVLLDHLVMNGKSGVCGEQRRELERLYVVELIPHVEEGKVRHRQLRAVGLKSDRLNTATNVLFSARTLLPTIYPDADRFVLKYFSNASRNFLRRSSRKSVSFLAYSTVFTLERISLNSMSQSRSHFNFVRVRLAEHHLEDSCNHIKFGDSEGRRMQEIGCSKNAYCTSEHITERFAQCLDLCCFEVRRSRHSCGCA